MGEFEGMEGVEDIEGVEDDGGVENMEEVENMGGVEDRRVLKDRSGNGKNVRKIHLHQYLQYSMMKQGPHH